MMILSGKKWIRIRSHLRLELYSLIERVVMKQTGDEYEPCNLVENLLAVLTMKQTTNQYPMHNVTKCLLQE
jgi:hypothetical protein